MRGREKTERGSEILSERQRNRKKQNSKRKKTVKLCMHK